MNTETTKDYYAALLRRRGAHIASHSVRPSVCPSVRPSRYRSLPSVTSRHLANYNDTHVRAAYRTVISAAQILVLGIITHGMQLQRPISFTQNLYLRLLLHLRCSRLYNKRRNQHTLTRCDISKQKRQWPWCIECAMRSFCFSVACIACVGCVCVCVNCVACVVA